MFKNIGPGVLVAAAFIGPGTVTSCTLAGVEYGYGLLWAMLLSVLATLFMQEMSARLGIITQSGLADAVNSEVQFPFLKYFIFGAIFSAIVIGNAAYEGGNIGGGTLGLEAIFGITYAPYYPFVVATFVFTLLIIGNYKILEKVFILLVLLMSISFIVAAIITQPNIEQVLEGLFIPKVPEKSMLMIAALVGTTIVPYNLFLHASLAHEKWKSPNDLKMARRDSLWSIGLGGLVSMAVIISAAALKDTQITNAIDMAKGLEPLYGNLAKYFMGIGLFAAGITSAITAPLAAAYVANSCFNWKSGLAGFKFRAVWLLILILGLAFTSLGFRPVTVIKFAQVANGILLPVIAIFLLWAVSRGSIMGRYTNSSLQNIVGLIIIVLVMILGVKIVWTVF
ncbi:Nramp family divalent metal transporter [Pareuzebyella sediminis]|uniref:Nramp family divalent metal transporter n=1 Tax=Pareuzebyella sediminis TaxID=2607998 RepID=UPI0011EC3DBF|nr:Nramp family divalent metal transporter [Pareuzebyella sediminis]